jgi:hypothetical protein
MPPASARPAPGVPSPVRWGTEAGLRELFGSGIASLQVTPRTIAQRYASAQHCVEHLRAYFGPVVATFAGLDAERQVRLMREMVEEVQRFNRSDDETCVVPCDYLEAVAITR